MASTDGFVRLPNWLIDDSDLSWNELAVYIVLLRFRDPKTGECFPGMTTIADRARISRKTVERVIPKLEARQMIRVKRRSTLTVNTPNVYTVALADETPKFVWEKSARGRRVPKHPRKKTTDTESVGADVQGEPTDTESVPTDTESPPPQTHSRPKKIQKNKIQEQAMRREQELEPEDLFTFAVEEKATAKQIAYLSDLYIFLTERIPEQRTRDQWAALDTTAASRLIDTYWGQMDRGRGGMWESNVNEIHSAYRALSPLGKRWITNGCLPDALEVA